MGSVWFGLGLSRSRTVGYELLKVQSELLKQRFEATRGGGG